MQTQSTTPWPDDAVHDRLIADWSIYQRRGGHRTGTDDFLAAWFAVSHCGGEVERYLDLGCGIGSVLLMTAQVLRPTVSIGIEAQPQSAMMAQRSVDELPANAPSVQVMLGDIREHGSLPGQFDLISGSPPYFPLNAGVLPKDEQRRACRFEVRGGVEDYCRAAAAALTPDGTFTLVHQTTWHPRVSAAAAEAGLHEIARADVHMRVDRPDPFLSVYAFGKAPSESTVTTFSVREVDGSWTTAYQRARAAMGYQ